MKFSKSAANFFGLYEEDKTGCSEPEWNRPVGSQKENVETGIKKKFPKQ
jgi:hypothetical protein